MSAVTFARLRDDQAAQNAVTSFTFAASLSLSSAAPASPAAATSASIAAPVPHVRRSSRRSIVRSVMSVPLLSTLDLAEASDKELLLVRQSPDELLELQILLIELLYPIGRGRELLRVAPIVDDGAA